MIDIPGYALRNYFLNHPIDPTAIDIGYGDGSGARVRVVDRTRRAEGPGGMDLGKGPVWQEWNGRTIPFLFSDGPVDEIISRRADGGVTVNHDILGGIFFFLSGWQELHATERDHHGRFPFSASVQMQWDITELPVVNYYYAVLSRAICMAYGLEHVPSRFEQDGFVTFVSHDIDECRTGWLQGSWSEMKAGKPVSALRIVLDRMRGRDIWFNFTEILDFHAQRALPATFFFIPRKGRDTEHGGRNADYDIGSPALQQVFEAIVEADDEIALHGSLGSALVADRMQQDVQRMPMTVLGHRSHFLLYDLRTLPSVLEAASTVYDNSCGFAERIGFRHGTCSPFFLYDAGNARASRVIEIPLIIMDRTLGSAGYMNVPRKEVVERCRNVIGEVRKFHGTLSILWHNNYFSPYKFGGWRAVLDRLLDLAEAQGTTYMNGRQIIDRLRP